MFFNAGVECVVLHKGLSVEMLWRVGIFITTYYWMWLARTSIRQYNKRKAEESIITFIGIAEGWGMCNSWMDCGSGRSVD